jgi:hypothetical protein
MHQRIFEFALTVVATATVSLWHSPADDGEKPKYTIKQVMKEAHKDGLFKKVVDGKGSDDDKSKLLELYEALEKNKPPKGTMKEWETRTQLIVAAAKQVVEGTGAESMLKKAVNCVDCHMAHKR